MKSSIYFIYALFLFFVTSLFSLATAANSNNGVIDIPKTELSIFVPVGMKPTLFIPNKELPDVANQAGWEFTFNTDNNGDKYILWNRDIAAAEFEVQGLLEDGKWVGIRKVNQYGIKVDNEILSFPKIRIGVCNYFGCNQLGTSNEIYISAQTGQFFTIPQITRPKFIPITYKDNFFLVPRKIDASSNHDFLLREKFVDAITYSNQLLLWNTSIDATEFEIQGLTEAGEWVTIKTVSQYGVEIDDAMCKFQKLRVRVCDYHGCGNLSVSKARKPTSDFLIPDSQPLIDPQLSSVENVGAIAAKAGVNGGAATYHIPVKLPPGRAEMQPNIALNYSSSSGIGIAGRGWSLSGLQSISRCDATVAQDGYSATPSYSTSDKLCLNGQRLIAVSGTYGKNGTTYRTELDSFVRVTQVHDITMDSTYFGVRYKNGRVAYFGLNENSRVVHGDKTAAYSWLIAYEVDASGRNFIHYDYVTAGAGEQLISTIAYTGNAADSKGRNTIEFTYQDKRQSSLRYVAGGRLESTKRLAMITTKVSNTQVNSYDLEYENNEANSTELLSSVTQCFATNSYCLPATKINWHNKPIHYDVKKVADRWGNTLTKSLSSNYPAAWLPDGDRNGDGIRDWPKHFVDPEGNSKEHNLSMPTCVVRPGMMKAECTSGDFNRDGLTDLWVKNENNKLQLGFARFNNTPKWFTTDISLGAHDTVTNISDFNRDGYADIVIYRGTDYRGGTAELQLYLNSKFSGNTTFEESRKHVIHSWYVDRSHDHKNTVTFPGDLDKDGIPDIAISEPVEVSFSRGQIFTHELTKALFLNWSGSDLSTSAVDIKYSGASGDESAFSMLFDVNGDGLMDWLGWRNASGSDGNLHVAMNMGDRTFGAPYSLGRSIATRPMHYQRSTGGGETEWGQYLIPKFLNGLTPFDVDGDGKTELIMPGKIDTEYCVNVRSSPSVYVKKCGGQLYGYYNSGTNNRVNLQPGIDSSIYKYDAYHFVYKKLTGKYAIEVKNTDIVGRAGQTFAVDGFGKGLTDLVFLYKDEDCVYGPAKCYYKDPVSGSKMVGKDINHAYYNRNSGSVSSASSLSTYQPNAIVESIQDGLGRKARWKLLPLSSSQGGVGTTPHYETDHSYIGALDNAFHFSSSMYTVSRFEQSNGVGGMSAIEYAYKGAVFSADGRGFLGFRSIIEKNVDKSLITQSDFSQEFPRHGKLITKATFKAGDFDYTAPLLGDAKNETKAISHSEFKWVDNPSHWVASGKVYHDYLSKRIQVTRDINDLSTIIGTQSQETRKIDQYGNPTEIFSSTSDSWNTRSSQIVNVYDNDSTNWWLNKLTRTKTTKYAATNRYSNDALTLYQGNIKDLDIETHILRVMSDFHTSRKPKKIVESATSGKGKIISTVFNSYGLPTKVTTTAKVLSSSDTWLDSSRTEALSYSDDGYFAETVSNAKGHTVTTVTDAATGLPKSVKTQVKKYDYVTTTYSYDNYTRPYTEKTSGLPAVYQVTSEPDSNAPSYSAMQVTTQSAGKPTTKTYLDKFNRVLRIATQNDAGQWIYVDTGYDKQGNKTRESRPYLYSNPRYDIEYKNFDALGRPKSKVTPQYCGPNSHGKMTAQYEYIGLTTEISVSETCYGLALGTMSRSYSIDKQLIETQDALGGYTRYAYNSMGLPIVVRDANGNSIVAKYNGMGRKIQVNDPNQGQTNFSYNGFGELVEERRDNKKMVMFYYDKLGRVISRKATGEGTQTFVFDTQSYGQLGEASANGVSHKYYYDNLGRPTIHDVTGDGQRFVTYTFYDENYGRVSGMRYPNGLTLEYKYNDYGTASLSPTCIRVMYIRPLLNAMC
ncbi:VCBS repeat-containing protein [Pseudoalteromonas luteoviolacea]|uniref:SpvB/TcaC N-terminal domain-containing protein n=1 Tax=Pseudoalteromonas luteoviolacea TaxID=43657 RepID=UPI001B37674B|nr:SpvB/TcaC N-terminal domain-containing protein [Pseudoalteromonas luteoviolacea]MBQ4811523.1 VCBS repeat-containing protein [Pseudoalteromonas luteoviolacea]